MPGRNLYFSDFHTWTLVQSAKLRAVAEHQEQIAPDIDWVHICDELEGLGHAERRKVEESLLIALKEIIQIAVDPGSETRESGMKRLNAVLDAAVDAYSASMGTHIDLQGLWEKAGKRVARDMALDGEAVADMPEIAPFTLAQLLDEGAEREALVAALVAAMASDRPGFS